MRVCARRPLCVLTAGEMLFRELFVQVKLKFTTVHSLVRLVSFRIDAAVMVMHSGLVG
jgi:hypothetical protein